MPQIIIVGAGISGLSLAFRLQQSIPAAQITILEQNQRPGGTVHTEVRDGFRVEAGPNGFLDTKPATIALCKKLGLESRLISASDLAAKNRYLFLDGKLKLLPNSLRSFLSSDLLTWRGKLSLLLEKFRPRRADTADESIDAFAQRRGGAEAALFADAMVTGIFAGDPAMLSAPACFPRLVQLEKEHGSILKGMAAAAKVRRREAKIAGEEYKRPGRMWSFSEGMSVLIAALADRLRQKPILNAAVKSIHHDTNAAKRWTVTDGDGNAWQADAVILTCPAYQQASIVAARDPLLADAMNAIAYNRIVVVGLGYRNSDIPMSLDGFGFIAPQKTGRDLLGVQWCSSIFPGRAPDDAVLLRAMCGGWRRADIGDWDDDQILGAACSELQAAMGVKAAPFFTHIVRWPRAIPQYHLGHRERVEKIEARLAAHPGLFVGGNAYHGVALNDCTEQAEILTDKVQRYLQQSQSRRKTLENQ